MVFELVESCSDGCFWLFWALDVTKTGLGCPAVHPMEFSLAPQF